MADSREPALERRAWPTIASCAIAVVALVVFFSTTTLDLQLSFGGKDHSSFGFNLASGMGWWFHFTVIATFVVGAVLGFLGGAKERPLRPLAWAAFAVNALAAVVLGAFIAIAYAQSLSSP